MKAAVFRGPHNMQIEEVPNLVCGPNDVIAKVLACGICGSDLHAFKLGLWAEDGWVMGHELSVEVTEVGSAIDGIVPGERIFAGSAGGPPCGECFWCGKGLRHLCERREAGETIGYSAVGGYSEAVVFRNVTPDRVMRIPGSVTPQQAAFVEPVLGAMNWVALADPQPEDTAVVIGAGVIGLVCLQLLKAVVKRVIVVEPSPLRAELAAGLGADLVIDPLAEDALQRLVAETAPGRYYFGEGGAAADLVMECAGKPQTFNLALDAARTGGRVVLVGLYEEPVSFDPNTIIHKSLSVISSFDRSQAQPFGNRGPVELIADGTVRVDPLITHRFPLDQINEAFEQQLRAADTVKVLVVPDGRGV